MYKRIVIADTSCLIILQKINRLMILKDIFQTISITREVAEEYGETLPDWIKIEKPENDRTKKILEMELDKGEASAIALGLEYNDVLLLIDEKKGRRVARNLGLTIMGTLGILVKAKEQGIITSLKAEIRKLQDSKFRIADELIEEILKKYD